MLVCIACARPVVYGSDGWVHRDPGECSEPSVAWPPAEQDDESDDEHAA